MKTPLSATQARLGKGPNVGPFATDGPRWVEAGIPVVPLNGKAPLVKNATKFTVAGSKRLLARQSFSAANLGYLAGAKSGLVVIDVDDPADKWVALAIDRYGDTPCKINTATGKRHLLYRWQGEGRQIRPNPLEPIDILGGGIVVAPPSVGEKGVYHFIEGGLHSLDKIPALTGHEREHVAQIAPSMVRAVGRKGSRNRTLFSLLLKHAPACDSLDDLLDVARTMNDGFTPPLEDREVCEVVKSAWGYETKGHNWAGQEGRSVVRRSLLDQFVKRAGEPGISDAFMLWSVLQISHPPIRKVFAVSPKAMAAANLMPGWNVKRYRRARDLLLEVGCLVRVKRGGAGMHDPDLYSLRPEGSHIGTQYNRTVISPDEGERGGAKFAAEASVRDSERKPGEATDAA
jgi:hypothetical protein